MSPIVLFWLRRDLRLEDNHGLHRALQSGLPVLPIFIFDRRILEKLEDPYDRRIAFIHHGITQLHRQLTQWGSGLWTFHGHVTEAFKQLTKTYDVKAVYTNEDYEPEALRRDAQVAAWLQENGIACHTFKDQCIFAKDEVLNGSGRPYTVFTPYKKKWLAQFSPQDAASFVNEACFTNFLKQAQSEPPPLNALGFHRQQSEEMLPTMDPRIIRNYALSRDYPDRAGTTLLGIHLRFGTVSIRQAVRMGYLHGETWLSQLIWRDFFMQILFHFPYVVKAPFREKYAAIAWRNEAEEFGRWCSGRTGYPIVDAGMRQLNATGYMHNRVRMITAGFLCKHLLIDWRKGERYFAAKLLDYDLAANNGNWQWAAGTGCDAAPYFRVFNPERQAQKFDPKQHYVRTWIPEWGTPAYPAQMVDHATARTRALTVYKEGLDRFGL